MNIADKLSTIAEALPEVYEAGKKAEYDRFWDEFQNYGSRTDYHYSFAGKGWSRETFNPKYDIVVTGGDGMFMWFNWGSSKPAFDLKGHLENLGVKLDFSQCVASCYRPFYRTNISRIGVVDLSISSTSLASFFYGSTVSYVEKLIIPNNYTGDFNNTFYECSNLSSISFGGTIEKSIDFKYSPLNKESIKSVIDALSPTASGNTATFKQSAKESAFTDDEWDALKETKPNWTISLI